MGKVHSGCLMFKYDNMFCIPLLQLECENWQVKKQQLKSLATSLKLEDTTYTDYYTMLSEGGHNKNIPNIFKTELIKFKEFFNLNSMAITSSWFERSMKNHHHPVHNHGPIGYSTVCYVDYSEEDHTPVTFLSPFDNFTTGENMYYRPSEVREGTILFFPSVINHFTLPNTSEKERLIFSFNLKIN